ncbi:MAG: agmatine deiminase family protein [Thermoplasmata archaeon]
MIEGPASPLGTPRELGYRMPAEWEPHAATWIAWPHQHKDWPGKFASIPWTYVEIVRNLSVSERVEILVEDPTGEQRARRALITSGVDTERVHFHSVATDRSWTRDSGPTFVSRSEPPRVGAVHWQFNAWAKYEDWHLDREVPAWISDHLAIPRWRPEVAGRWFVLEGGAIETNGDGLLLATEECLLSDVQARNPGLSRATVESVLGSYLGIDQVIWLPRGIQGDDTHGHVDDVARFVEGNTLLLVATDDERDADFSALRACRAALEDARRPDGRRIEVRTLPAPRPVLHRRQRLPASYANVYIANRTVLVPSFDDPHDSEALDVIRRAFPERTVVGVRSRDLVWGLGTIHCLTQQQPAGGPPDSAREPI